jgi:hypothetical protein
MDTLGLPLAPYDDSKLLRLAREIACELQSLPVILNAHSINDYEWETIRVMPRFQQLLASAIEEWHSATATPERVKVKAAAMIEQVLPELYARLVDPKGHLGYQIDGLKWLKDLAGIGARGGTAGEASHFSVTINLGAANGGQLKIEKQTVIEGEAL